MKKLNMQRSEHKFYLVEQDSPEPGGYKNKEVTQDELLDLFNRETSPLKFMHFISNDDDGVWITICDQFKSLNTKALAEVFEKYGF